MLVSDLLTALRYKLTYDTTTDYQITDALNYVMKEINLALNSISSSLIITSATMPLVDNVATLPSDLESIIMVYGKTAIPFTEELDANTYQIVGNTIQCQGDTVTIYYKKSYPLYVYDTTITPTTIDLPVSFDNMLTKNIINLLTGQPVDAGIQTIKLIANRDGKKRQQQYIFTV